MTTVTATQHVLVLSQSGLQSAGPRRCSPPSQAQRGSTDLCFIAAEDRVGDRAEEGVCSEGEEEAGVVAHTHTHIHRPTHNTMHKHHHTVSTRASKSRETDTQTGACKHADAHVIINLSCVPQKCLRWFVHCESLRCRCSVVQASKYNQPNDRSSDVCSPRSSTLTQK